MTVNWHICGSCGHNVRSGVVRGHAPDCTWVAIYRERRKAYMRDYMRDYRKATVSDVRRGVYWDESKLTEPYALRKARRTMNP